MRSLRGLFLFIFIIWYPLAQAEMYGKFMVVKGDVNVVRTDGKNEKAKVSLKVFPGDTIAAKDQSRAKIAMSDRNIIHVSPNTEFKIETYINDGANKNVEIKLNEGKLRNNVENKYDGDKNKFIIKTPTAVAGVRGTQFITSYNPASKTTQVFTLKGVVELRNFSASSGTGSQVVVVKQGESSTVDSNGPPRPPAPMAPKQMDKMDKDTDTGTDVKDKKAPKVDGKKSSTMEDAKDLKSDTMDTVKKAPIKVIGGQQKGPMFRPPPPVIRNLPADAIRNQNDKTRVIIQPKTPGS